MIDTSHGPLPTEAEVKRQLDFLARWKNNQYYLCSEASIEMKGYPVQSRDARSLLCRMWAGSDEADRRSGPPMRLRTSGHRGRKTCTVVMEASASKEQPLEVWTQVRKLMGIDFGCTRAYARAL